MDPDDPDRLTYQVWLNRKEDGFELLREGQLPPGTGQISFADMGAIISLHLDLLKGLSDEVSQIAMERSILSFRPAMMDNVTSTSFIIDRCRSALPL